MICHVVLVRLRPEVDENETAAFLLKAREILAPIPGVENFNAGRNIRRESAFPVALVMEFANEGRLQAYQVHAEHQRFLKDVIGPIIEEKQVYDYTC